MMVHAEPPGADLWQRCCDVLAQIEGQITAPGLSEPVEILRDLWGIAHIYARNSHDLFFAQGYSMAQDRLFQVDLWRRMARGETAELFGDEALAADRFARLIRYRGDMDAEWNSYSPQARDIATAFVAGINAFIDAAQDRLPIEFQLAGYRPAKWEPADVLGRMSGIVMSSNWEMEVARARLIQTVGIETARMLAPTDPVREYAPAPELDLESVRDEILNGLRAATRVLRFTPATTESNNWVVGGRLSSSGKPMLASDPHRSTTLPSLRYLVHLHAPGWNVIGSGEPALPGVAIGHNERIAWGFTIVGTDQADLYVERTHPDDPRRYLVGDRWESMQISRESVRVRGKSEPVTLELRFTRHGPVVYQDESRQFAVALRWAGSDPGGAAYLASLAVNQASNREEFLAALSRWKLPGLNFVYADVDGEIGWVAAGATPVRREGDGLLPAPGDSDRYEWDRYLKSEEWPQSFNPPTDWLATANHNIVPAGYPHHIAGDWFAPYRYLRIADCLRARGSWTLEDFQRLQHDTVALPALALQGLIQTVEFPIELLPWVRLFAEWDGNLTASSQAGALFAVWMEELLTAMYDLHVELPPTQDRIDLRSTPVVLQHLTEPTAAWFGAEAAARRDSLLRSTLSAAVQQVQRMLGDDPATWSWGRLHQATFHHRLACLGPEIAQAFNLGPVPRGGNDHTPMNTKYDADFQQIHGATYRHVLDLADWDRGLATSAPGQSGQPGSPHYADLLPLWADGRYFPLAYSRDKVAEVTRHRLLLMPVSGEW